MLITTRTDHTTREVITGAISFIIIKEKEGMKRQEVRCTVEDLVAVVAEMPAEAEENTDRVGVREAESMSVPRSLQA
jgi:hypothetical protein